MGKLSTHVLDTMHGKPAQGIAIKLFRLETNGNKTLITTAHTNSDGRCDQPLLDANTISQGEYELLFAIGDYFTKQGVTLPQPNFLNYIPIRFGIADPTQNYHVPLVVTPWTYSTYRGS